MSEFHVFVVPHPVEDWAVHDMVDWLKESVDPADYELVYFVGMDDPADHVPVEIHVRDPDVLDVLRSALCED
ncbi:MAG: hypothetical protein EOP84_18270 [Verrucomicrobiaceae bacterium]|nr:MAG: hypothetical protein EOP84_18270 [Verrucomicrobiaceae bacterium]